MTIPTTAREAGPFTSGTNLPFTFITFATSELEVRRVDLVTEAEQVLVLGPDYTVTLNPDQDSNPGGTVVLAVAIDSGNEEVIIRSAVPYSQEVALPAGGPLPVEAVERALDRAVVQIKQIRRDFQSTADAADSANAALLAQVAAEQARDAAQDELGVVQAAGAAQTAAVQAAGGAQVVAIENAGEAEIEAVQAAGIAAAADAVAARDAAVVAQLAAEASAAVTGGASYRNKIMNGKMEVRRAPADTSYAGLGPSSGNQFVVSRWRVFYNASGTVTASQAVDAPLGFYTSLRVTVTTAQTPVQAGARLNIRTAIEGFDARDLIGRTFVLSFWVKSSKPGVYCVAFVNSGSNRSFVSEYTIDQANTWERKTLTCPGGLITDGSWNFDNGTGLAVSFSLVNGDAGATTGNPGSWLSGFALTTAQQVNFADTVGAVFGLTGVQLEVGSVASPFEHRMYSTEQALCARYRQVLQAGASAAFAAGFATSNQIARCLLHLPVVMRAGPTLYSENVGAAYRIIFGSESNLQVLTCTGFSLFGVTPQCGVVQPVVADGLTLGQACYVAGGGTAASGFIGLEADL